MGENWIIIISAAVAALALIIFLIVRNLKDAKELEKNIINEEKTTLAKEDDTEIETNEWLLIMETIKKHLQNKFVSALISISRSGQTRTDDHLHPMQVR